ncbi:hypothetical protein HAV15_006242 [Penicillium sp. str. |nr:hypothetical protein HAV15_006242 [Penicillium sp. str. \
MSAMPLPRAVIYQSSCTLSNRWDIALHLTINILGTSILAASNYCMQTLVAPTREEIDEFHVRGRWLDIGSASVKNLLAIGRGRLVLWVVLLITTTPFHLFPQVQLFDISILVHERIWRNRWAERPGLTEYMEPNYSSPGKLFYCF